MAENKARNHSQADADNPTPRPASLHRSHNYSQCNRERGLACLPPKASTRRFPEVISRQAVRAAKTTRCLLFF